MTKKQFKKLLKLKKPGEFRPGKAGCESRLYRVKGRKPLMAPPDEKAPVLMVAADDIPEVLAYMMEWEPGFDSREHQATVHRRPLERQPAALIQSKGASVKKQRRAFPYENVAAMWAQGKTISEIGERTGYVDDDREDNDRFHTLRSFLMRMHAGYKHRSGKIVKLTVPRQPGCGPCRERVRLASHSTPVQKQEGRLRTTF